MTIAIVGRTGSGKTFAAKGLVEPELDAGARVCVIDPTGAWWGMRLRPDGTTPAYPVVIFGGEHGDVPIAASQGDALAAAIIDGRAPRSVVDVSEMTGGEQAVFLTALFERLYTRNRAPLTLVMDEADIMAPQDAMPEHRRLKGATNKIVRRGRIKGFRVIMITQRPAVLDKSVLSQIDTLIAMRLTAPQDRKAIEEWVKGNADAGQARQVLDSLASLARGEGWFWAPHDNVLERRTFPAIATFDSSRAPEPGDAPREVAPLSLADIDGLRAAFAPEISAPSNAEAKISARDGDAALRVEIARLGRELLDAEKRGYARGRAEAELRALGGIARLMKDLELDLRNAPSSEPPFAEARPPGEDAPAPAPRVNGAPHPKPAMKGPSFNGAANKMFAVLDTEPPMRLTWTQLATLAGLKPRGGHFNAGRKALREAGLREDGDLVWLAANAVPTPALDEAAMLERWAQALPGLSAAILRLLFEKGPMTRRAIAEKSGVKDAGGHWNSAWKRLRDNGLVVITGERAALADKLPGSA